MLPKDTFSPDLKFPIIQSVTLRYATFDPFDSKRCWTVSLRLAFTQSIQGIFSTYFKVLIVETLRSPHSVNLAL